MSCHFRTHTETEISIPRYMESSSATYYDIKIKVKSVEWLVERRYRDFVQLHDNLVEELSISKKLLPPKKIVGNKNRMFLEQRREQLEKYLQDLLLVSQMILPKALAEFLDFNKYDIVYLLQDLAKLFCENGESLLSSKKEFNLSALEVFAISERLSIPCPPENVELRGKYDFSHVLDFCTQLEVLVITPVKENTSFSTDYNAVDVPIGRSNIIPQNLCFHLNAFRNLRTLKFYSLSTENIVDVTLLKPTLTSICVHHTTITHINQVLMCDNVHKNDVDAVTIAASSSAAVAAVALTSRSINNQTNFTSTPSTSKNNMNHSTFYDTTWRSVIELDLTGNLLTQIDLSIRTAPQLRKLVLEQNRIKAIQNLADLPCLQVLSLSANLITECNDWHLELGNLVTLNLAQNKLKNLQGLRKLLSLVNLDLSCNQIEDLDEVDNIARLPILETLRLTGNPIAGSVDYRPRVLSRFHERASEISLDNERGTQKELDCALVLSALQISKLNQSINGNQQ